MVASRKLRAVGGLRQAPPGAQAAGDLPWERQTRLFIAGGLFVARRPPDPGVMVARGHVSLETLLGAPGRGAEGSRAEGRGLRNLCGGGCRGSRLKSSLPPAFEKVGDAPSRCGHTETRSRVHLCAAWLHPAPLPSASRGPSAPQKQGGWPPQKMALREALRLGLPGAR